ncbi:MAG: acyl-CoA--6-aminopenicillanic acid acyl-transferase [Candidatus Delongbacteria bacterium]|nr:MAG: acyl-CoA--6-aminopenicillanic acid acyl-transferase [Candidatus Delongbacteria bacterium]
MDHIKLVGKHYEVGQKLGHFLKEKKSEFPIKLNKNQLRHGVASLKILEDIFPEAFEEIKGLTEEIKFNHELFGSWIMCMGCCLTMRENHNVEIRGCTALGFIDKNKIYYGRDNDLPPYLKKMSKSIIYEIPKKNKFVLNTSSFINGEEGINEYGLIVAMTFVIPKVEDIRPGLNSVFLVRYILENCKTVQDAIKSLEMLPISSSCNILLIDKKKEMVVVECSPFETNIRYPEKNGNGNSFIVTVNHFSSKKMKKYDRSKQNVYSSKARYITAYNSLKQINTIDSISYIKEILSGKYGFMCQYKNVKFETIWSTIFDPIKQKMYLAAGNPIENEYKEFNLFE